MKRQSLLTFVLCAGLAGAAHAAEPWPQWGGPQRDFSLVSRELARDWGEDGPAEVWSRPLGGGFAGIVSDGKWLYTHYRDGDDEVVVSLDPENGKTRWEYRYEAKIPKADHVSTEYGKGPNATPVLVDGKVVTLGFMGHATCVDGKTGKPVWQHSLNEDFQVQFPYFGHASSPLSLGDRVVFVAGGLLAFELDSGELAWENRDHQGSYGSPNLVEVGDRRQIVTPLEGTIAGFDPETGKKVWSRAHKNQWGTISSSPVVDDAGRVFFSTSQVGGVLIDPGADGDAKPILVAEDTEIGHWNAVRAGDLLFTSVGGSASFLTATSLADGKQLWKERGFAKANLLRVGDQYLLLDFEGELALVELDGEGMNVVAQATINTKKTWTPPTLLGTTLYFRDESRIAALDLSAGKAK